MKEFKVAHIVPVSHLADTKNNQYHMCLSHLVSDPAYQEHFAKMSDEGKFVLMDNGAAEGCQLCSDDLLCMYELIRPTEIVLPDTLYSPGSTIQKSRSFLSILKDRGLEGKYRTMAVPQGVDLDEWIACATVFVKDTRVNSIGVSKFLNIITRDKYARFKACMALNDLFKAYGREDMEVHLLGCDEGPLVVRMCHDAFPFVRGCDSAFAYLAAQAGQKISLEKDSRPSGTIDFIDGKWICGTTYAMRSFDVLAGASDNGVCDSWRAAK